MSNNPPHNPPKHKVPAKLQQIHVNNKKRLQSFKTQFNPSNTSFKLTLHDSLSTTQHSPKTTNDNKFHSIIRFCIEMPQSHPKLQHKEMPKMPNNAILLNHSNPDPVHQTQTSTQHLKIHQQHQELPSHPAPDFSHLVQTHGAQYLRSVGRRPSPCPAGTRRDTHPQTLIREDRVGRRKRSPEGKVAPRLLRWLWMGKRVCYFSV